MRSVFINAVGSLQRGLLTNYFNRIHINDSNVTKSTLNTVGKSFLLNAKIQVPKNNSLEFLQPTDVELNNFCVKSNVNEKNSLVLDEYDYKYKYYKKQPFHVVVDESRDFPFAGYSSLEVHTLCADHSGIIANHLSILENGGAFITNFDSECEGAPHSGTPVFSLVIKSAIKHDVDISAIIERLRNTNTHNVTTIILDDKVVEEYSGFGF